MNAFTGKIASSAEGEAIEVEGVYERVTRPVTRWAGRFMVPLEASHVIGEGGYYDLDIDSGPRLTVRIGNVHYESETGRHTAEFTSVGVRRP